MKKTLKIAGIVLLALLLVVLAYVAYVFLSYHRIEDNLSLTPEGGAGTCIYDRMPYLQPSSLTIEGFMGNRPGTALHQAFFHVTGLSYAIPYKVQIIRQ